MATINLDTVEFFFQQAWQSIVRNWLMALAAVCNMAVAFAVLGGFALVAWNLEHMARAQAAEAVVNVDLAEEAVAADVEVALKRDPRVSRTRFVPRDEALKAYAEKTQLDMKALELIENPLPDSFTVWPVSPDDIPEIAEDARRIKGVDQSPEGVRYGGQVTKKLLALSRATKLLALGLTILLGAAALLIVSTTIRLTIWARRREIRIMQLVGATNGFIMLPFLIEGVLQGLAGATIATTALLLSYEYVARYIAENLEFVNLVTGVGPLVGFSLIIVGGGMAFGAVGAVVGLRRHLSVV